MPDRNTKSLPVDPAAGDIKQGDTVSLGPNGVTSQQPQNDPGTPGTSQDGPTVTPPVNAVQNATQGSTTPPDTVTIPRADWEAMTAKVDLLYQAGDKGRIAAIEGRGAGPIAQFVTLTTMDDKLVVAWRSVKDEIRQNANGQWITDQVTEVIFEDNSKLAMPLLDFYRKKAQGKVRGRIVERNTQTMRVALDSGREVVVGIAFVN